MNDLVATSRAGDAFHYRWAARRCLKLVDFRSDLQEIVVEGSKEWKKRGEYQIDLAEYFGESGKRRLVRYLQLKHSCKQLEKHWVPSELADTLKGFAGRFTDLKRQKADGALEFVFVSNRPVAENYRATITAIGLGQDGTLKRKLENATGLKGKSLREFCQVLKIVDTEGSYLDQRRELQREMSGFVAGGVEGHEIDNLIALVEGRVLPPSSENKFTNVISDDDVLSRMGVSSPRDLFPAKSFFEQLKSPLIREGYRVIKNTILKENRPVIVEASGGVGKSVLTQYLRDSLPDGSFAVAFDCFAAGNYRKASDPRHLPQVALVQIANEMAVKGLCLPLVPRPNDREEHLFQHFLDRLEQAITELRRYQKSARLVILIDAADNAEMQALETGSSCFAGKLLRENLPDGCVLVELGRPGAARMGLVNPPSDCTKLELSGFSKNESGFHLRSKFPDANDDEVLEFHRLSHANPRVQANELGVNRGSVNELLIAFGPLGTTVEKQIEGQLQSAIARLKDQNPLVVAKQIDSICLGLANLPPFVPIDVLAEISSVDCQTVEGFVSDLGRPLWITDDAVQFRDEPTEKWFRDSFGAQREDLLRFVEALEPLAEKSAYVAATLPQLLLKAEKYERLIELALSEDSLPIDNPVEARILQVNRLQFAFKAALKAGLRKQACLLAMRAGEEMAGNQRQNELFEKNLNLVSKFQNPDQVQELVYGSRCYSSQPSWASIRGASLLSEYPEFRGEARSYLRTAEGWLTAYFEQKESSTGGEISLGDDFFVELGQSYLNLHGAKGLADFFLRWSDGKPIFRVTRILVSRLLDGARFEEVERVSELCAERVHVTLAISLELNPFRKSPHQAGLDYVLRYLARKNSAVPSREHDYERMESPMILSVLAVCEAAVISQRWLPTVTKILNKFWGAEPVTYLGSMGGHLERYPFMRAVALKAVLMKSGEPPFRLFVPKVRAGREDENRELKHAFEALIPILFQRARLLAGEKVTQDELKAAYDKARIALSSTYGQRRDLDFESSFAGFQMIAASLEISQSDLQYWETRLFPAAKVKIGLGDSLKAMQIVCRLDNLKTLRIAVEASCKRMLRPSSDLEAEERGGSFVSMARAVMSVSAADGQAYFDKAVEAVSKFGDEVVYRWEALVVAAKASASDVNCGERTTYRFIRCAEAVGDSVAREKYWNREEVFAVAANMNLPTSLVMLSRWRDRRVGWFSELLSPWIHECVEKNLAEPAVLWSFTGFREMNHLGWIASQCIRKLKDSGIKKKIFQTTVRDLRIIGDLSKLEEILDVAKEFPPDAKAIEELVAREKSSQISSENTKRPEEWSDEKDPKEKMGKLGPILASLDTSNAPSLTEALTKLGQSEPPRESDLFWELVVSKVDSGKEVDFLKAFFKLQRIDVGDAMKVLRLISAASWRGKISVERYWLTFVKRLGAKFPEKFANHYSMVYFNSFYTFSERELDSLAEGISEALSESAGIMPAETYYGFAKSEIARLSPNESLEILEFALARFEIHFPDDEAGGVWTEGFCPPSAREEVVAGFLWAALGSPYSHERWEAAHVVRRLAETSCRKEICALAKLLMTDTAGCFSDPELPFYVLHARLYLLMAFERIVSESPSLLLPYAQSFRQLALEGFPHILIESRAAAISLVLEGKHPGTFDDETFDSLKKVGKSPFPPEFENLSKGYPDTPWHLEGSINLELEYSFEYEFDWYWFEQLSRVFAVSPKQVEQLAAELALKHIDPSKKCDDSDPRRHQFNSGHYSERGTRHSHGRYPKDDSYSFYCSYHSFLSVASLLLSRVPGKKDSYTDGECDRFKDWLNRHWLTRSDGRWLSERRDPAPVVRRQWTRLPNEETWQWGVGRDDFLDVLREQSGREGHLVVSGNWTDTRRERYEDIEVTCSLIDPEKASALASNFRRAKPHDIELPRCGDSEIENRIKGLTGWITNWGEDDSRRDGFDPHCGAISHPPPQISPKSADQFSVKSDHDKRNWVCSETGEVVAFSEVWRCPEQTEEYYPERSGNRLVASFRFLRYVCETTEKHLIFCVRINRHFHQSRYSHRDDKTIYAPSSHKIFVLDEDGRLSDGRSSVGLW